MTQILGHETSCRLILGLLFLSANDEALSDGTVFGQMYCTVSLVARSDIKAVVETSIVGVLSSRIDRQKPADTTVRMQSGDAFHLSRRRQTVTKQSSATRNNTIVSMSQMTLTKERRTDLSLTATIYVFCRHRLI